jgi:tetratricopeptide (TPR) repeat protein
VLDTAPRSVTVLVVTLALCGTAEAQGRGSQPSPDALRRAVVLFEESEQLYNEGHFAEAAALLRRAYELHPDPTLLFNLARALEGLGDLDGSIETYERFLHDSPTTPDRGAIERRLQTLRQQRDRLRGIAPPEPEPEPEAAAQPAAPSAPIDPAPWILAGAGAAVVGVGIGLGVASAGDASAAQAEPVQVRAVELHSRAESLAIAADVLFVAGGIAAVAGVVWGIVSVTSARPSDVAVAIGPGGVSVAGRW